MSEAAESGQTLRASDDGSKTTLLSSTYPQVKTLTTTKPHSTLRKNYWLSIALHVILVLIHVGLVVVRFAGVQHNENRIVVPLGSRANTISVAITVISQIFGVGYLTGQVLILQQLALRKTLHVSKTITAVHDKYSAWNGLGAALSSVMNQCKLATSVWGVTAVAVYLGGVSVLHVTIPSTFSLATFNRTYSATAQVQFNTPIFSSSSMGMIQDMENAASALPLLSYLAHTNASLGVHGNLIFNSISNAEIDYYADIAGEFPIANTTINTTATIFHVTCGLIPDAKQNGTSNGLTWNVNTPIQNGTIAGGNTNPPFKLLAPYAIRMLPLNYGDYYSSAPSILLYASVNITDNQGHNGTTVALDPPMNFGGGYWPEEVLDGTWTTTVVGCNLQIDKKEVPIDPVSKNITGSGIPPRNASQTWQNWQALGPGQDPLVESWGSVSNIKSRTTIRTNNCSDPYNWVPNQKSTCGWDDYFTPAELYLNNQLGLSPVLSGQEQFDFTKTSISLANLELALENMTAAIYWAYANVPSSTDPSAKPNDFSSTFNTTHVLAYISNAHLNINTVPLMVGSVASLILLGISFYLSSKPDRSTIDSELNMVGVLQLMWLLGKGSSVQDRVADVLLPSTDNLRQAGLVDLQLSNIVRRGTDKEWEGSEE